MRALHIVKTSEGAVWAARLAGVLVKSGVEVHVALPSLRGSAVEMWKQAGALVHHFDINVSPSTLRSIPAVIKGIRRLVESVRPDLIHTYFVANTVLLRWALGPSHSIPRVYHVAGPLHLEHGFYRKVDIGSAGGADFWIGSSRAIIEKYLAARVPRSRLFLSYFGFESKDTAGRPNGMLRSLVNAAGSDTLVGNVNLMYPPKRFLGHRVGIKAHEDVIDALSIVCRKNPRTLGVLVGGAWGGAVWYEKLLRDRAVAAAGDRIRFTGRLPFQVAPMVWSDFSLAVHVPLSENCGGVIEPLHAGVPVIASRVGGIPEVVMDDSTGWLVPPRQPELLAEKILDVLSDQEKRTEYAARGRALIRTMFDLDRTGREVFDIYSYILGHTSLRPVDFDSRAYLESIANVRHEELPPSLS